jgi:AraC family transcriptional regulator, activator of mtrCDE
MTDLITDLLHDLRLCARVFHRGQHCGAWVIPIEGEGSAIFHLVTHGALSVETRHRSEAIDVEAGDLVLFPRGRPHALRARQSAAATEAHLSFADGLDDSSTGLVCGRFEFHGDTGNPLLESLPDVLVVPARSHPEEQWLRSLVCLIVWESTHPSAASEAVMERLAEALFIHALRSHLRENPASIGLLGAFGDPALRPVLEEMRRDPTRPWSLSAMAAVSKLSRSAFIKRFTRVLGAAPATYLKQLRLERGHRLLAESRHKVLDIALACGYASEAAFSKAFKREYGVPPSELRKRRRAGAAVEAMAG